MDYGAVQPCPTTLDNLTATAPFAVANSPDDVSVFADA